MLKRWARVTTLHSCAARWGEHTQSTARKTWGRRWVLNRADCPGTELGLPFPPSRFSFWAPSQTLLFLNLRDDDTLTKSRLCPGVWSCGTDLTLMGQRSISFAVSLPGRQAVFVLQPCTGASAVFKLLLGAWEPSWQWLLRDCSELLHPLLPGACSTPAPLLLCLNCDGWCTFRPLLTRGSETGILRLKEEIIAKSLKIELNSNRFTNEIQKFKVLMFYIGLGIKLLCGIKYATLSKAVISAVVSFKTSLLQTLTLVI